MDIVKVSLENEMDLMLAYKKSMKLAELCGLSVLLQTSFATAVSEIARCVIKDKKDKPFLDLKINVSKANKKELIAGIISKVNFDKDHPESVRYAKRLIDHVSIIKTGPLTEISFVQSIGFSALINEGKLDSIQKYFKTEIAISPYDEVRKKNIMLLEVSEKLRNSENKYRDLTRTLPLMIFTTNSLGFLNYGNKWLLDFFKIGELQADKLSWLTFLDISNSKKIREDWDKAMVSPTVFTAQAKLKVKDKDDFIWHLISLTPVKNEDNQLISWTGFFVDINSQKRVEETLKNNKELQDAQKQLLKYQKNLEEKVFELNKSNHDLEQFAYIASHDLQEPLRKIRSFSSLVKRNIGNKEEVEKYLSKIEMSSERMTTLIKDVLNYSRLIKVHHQFAETNLEEILKHVLQDMELAIEEKKAKIEFGSLPVINAVPQQIQQLFHNLVSNALKFNKGEPQIEIRSKNLSVAQVKNKEELHQGSNYIELSFKDNGIGFEEEYANQIFTIFQRLHTRESYSGTGIGLALCKKIVDNHHGLISVKSEVGKGTEFCIVLPAE
ncbi:MAG: ATP-binding protein [Bacteroidota bacterium]